MNWQNLRRGSLKCTHLGLGATEGGTRMTMTERMRMLRREYRSCSASMRSCKRQMTGGLGSAYTHSGVLHACCLRKIMLTGACGAQGTLEHRVHRPCRCRQVHNRRSDPVPHGASATKSSCCMQSISSYRAQRLSLPQHHGRLLASPKQAIRCCAGWRGRADNTEI